MLDCSAVLAMVFEDAGGDYGERLFDHFIEHRACAPEIWPLEVCNALIMAVRRKRLVRAEANHFFRLISALPVRIVPAAAGLEGYAGVLELSAEYRLSAYDAAYLALTMGRGLPLATLHEDLVRAAKAAGTPLFGG